MKPPAGSDVRAAAARLPNDVRHTPCVHSEWLSAIAGVPVWLKLEVIQPTRSFKVRGAANAVSVLGSTGSAGPLVTASAGNHGAALAWAARRAGLPVVVFAPRDAPAAKLARVASCGADLRATARDYDEAERLALAFASEQAAVFVSPYDDPLVIAGAGTIGLEIVEALPDVKEIVVPLGGGGLLSGIALAVRDAGSGCRLTGAEPGPSPAFTTALANGRVTPITVGATIADGLAGNLAPEALTFDLVRTLVDEVTTVDEPTLRRTVAALLEREQLVAEGAGAIGVAALLSRTTRPRQGPVVVVVSGANIDVTQIRELIAGPV